MLQIVRANFEKTLYYLFLGHIAIPHPFLGYRTQFSSRSEFAQEIYHLVIREILEGQIHFSSPVGSGESAPIATSTPTIEVIVRSFLRCVKHFFRFFALL